MYISKPLCHSPGLVEICIQCAIMMVITVDQPSARSLAGLQIKTAAEGPHRSEYCSEEGVPW